MRFKNLERMKRGGTSNRMELAVPLPKTPRRRVYRFSPNEKALPRHFVLGEAMSDFVICDEARPRMKQPPRSKKTVCPYSGVIADDDAFVHPDDAKAAIKVVEHAALADVESAIHEMFEGLARKFSSSKFMTFKAGPRPSPTPMPRFSRRDLLRELVCDHCGRDYGVYAIGLFCPDCGAPNLRLHFAREAQIVAHQVLLADQQEGQEELAYRLMGNAHEDVLTAFEATLKTVYLYGIGQRGSEIPAPKPVKNDFQNVDFGQRRFAELGLDPFAMLTPDEMSTLRLNIQKRHIIGHNLGVMDERFADFDEDAHVGETVRLVGKEITQFAVIAQRVIDGLDAWLAGGTPSPFDLPLPATDPGSPPTMVALPSAEPSDLGLTESALRLGKWVASNSTNGMTRFVDDEALTGEFSDISERALAEAAAELAADGYLKTSSTMGRVLPHMAPTVDLFAIFDPLAGIGDPVADSLLLAGKVLEGDDSINVESLHSQTGWPARRFNPALARLVAEIDERHVSRELQSKYPTAHVFLTAEDRVALRRYAARIAG